MCWSRMRRRGVMVLMSLLERLQLISEKLLEC